MMLFQKDFTGGNRGNGVGAFSALAVFLLFKSVRRERLREAARESEC